MWGHVYLNIVKVGLSEIEMSYYGMYTAYDSISDDYDSSMASVSDDSSMDSISDDYSAYGSIDSDYGSIESSDDYASYGSVSDDYSSISYR